MPSDQTEAPAGPTPEQIAEAEKKFLTADGRRQAADELTSLLTSVGVDAGQAQSTVEGDAGSNSPKKHAAAHTGRFFLETALRRDVAGLTQMVSLPFRFEDEVLTYLEAIKAGWFDALAKEGEPLAKAPAYSLAYQVIATVDEFKALDPASSAQLDGLELTKDDFVVGSILVSGTMAEALNYVLRWNSGSIKVAAIWT
ncbi:MAG: hypothetical protein KI792_12405 [Alphaproteobacteria bacterium]|nr:hypothetical protein [Alphaproteobacteria bacterium SS10]